MMIHCLNHARIDLHGARVKGAFCIAQTGPLARLFGLRRQACFGRNQADFLAFGQSFPAQNVPARIIAAIIIIDEFARCLHRNMHGLKRQIAEKRTLLIAAFYIVNHGVDK
ncbi:MAG: Uncharacterised protein [Alphaproteobacteria bacterium]|nr:MAG: Uncharacterised protein [Alphaproteobacteria bacterium]